MPALYYDIMARIGPFTLLRLFVFRLTLATITTFLSAQHAIASDQCYARQFIAFKEVTRNSETLTMELVVKDVASCINLCCKQRTKRFGGCDSISFDRNTSSCSLFRCSAYIACLPMNVKNSVNSYLFFNIPIPTTTPPPPFDSSTSRALATPVSTPLSQFSILSCPHNYAHEDVALSGKFIREVLLHDASTCLSFCCRHSRETGCRSVSFRSESFRCAMFRCADEFDCQPRKAAGVISYFTDKEQSDKLTPPKETTKPLTTVSLQNSDYTSTISAVGNRFDDSTAISTHDHRPSMVVLTGTTEKLSRFLNKDDRTRWTAAKQGPTDYFHLYSSTTLTVAPSSKVDRRTTTITSDSVLLTDRRSLTAAVVEKLGEQRIVNESTKPTAVAQTEVAAARTTTSATASADSAIRRTAPFRNDGLSLADRQITSQTPTDATDASPTKNTDALITYSRGEFDQPTETSFDQSSSLHALNVLRGATSTPPQASIAILPFETIDGKEPTNAAAGSRTPQTVVTRIVERKRIFTSASEEASGTTTARTWPAKLNRDAAASTAGNEQLERGTESSQNRQQSASSRTETSRATIAVSNTMSTSTAISVMGHLTLTAINKEEASPIANKLAPGTQFVDSAMQKTDATQSQTTTRTNGVTEQPHTVAVPLTYLDGTTIEVTRSESNDKAIQSPSSTVHPVEYDYEQSKVGVSMDSNDHLATVRVPIWMLSVVLAILIALLTFMTLIGLHILRLTLRSGEYNLLKALSSRIR